MKLSKLKSIPLREAWKHEALDFTIWLSRDENIISLSEEIGVDIEVIKTEARVGSYNVDILGEEKSTGKKVVIENQLETTNHDHLGKLLTYSAGIGASIIIWVVKEVRDEHKAAIDWLNDHSDDSIYFFIIQIALWQIGNSENVAPNFSVISEPNDWAKVMKGVFRGDQELTDTKLLQVDYWTNFRTFCEERNSTLKFRKPRPQHWYNLSIGSRDAHVAFTTNSRDDMIAIEVYIDDNKELYYALKDNSKNIEDDIGEKLDWMDLPSKKASRIKLTRDADFRNKDTQESQFNWLFENAVKFNKVFSKQIRLINRNKKT